VKIRVDSTVTAALRTRRSRRSGRLAGEGEKNMTLKVIGAGLGRTGTLSLKLALEQLGFAKCYHMGEVMAGGYFPKWAAVGEGKPDWDAIFDGYAATTDYPACTYWRELADYYPDAKVLLSVRDADSWYESTRATIFSEMVDGMIAGGPPAAQAMFNTALPMDLIRSHRDERDAMTAYFRAHNQAVIDGIAPERLLVFEVKQGWGPLCAFLGVDVPDEPFPRVNERDDLARRFSEASAQGVTIGDARLGDLDGLTPSEAHGATGTPAATA
jgi:hypothetical protein